MKILFNCVLCFFLIVNTVLAQNKATVKANLAQLVAAFDGRVGVVFENINTGQVFKINANNKFPMQSVYKLPLAMAVLDQIDNGKLRLDQKCSLKPSDLLPNTHSPLRDTYPKGTDDISLQEIVAYTVARSDNNGCDYLFRLLGGCQNVNNYIKKFQKKGINIGFTEEEMHSDTAAQYANFATPNTINALLIKFVKGNILKKQSTELLWNILVATTTAPNRMKGLLPKNTVVGHKSGWSGGDDRGYTNAINDVGIVVLPNGQKMAVSIFIADTKAQSIESDMLAAKLTKLAFDYFNK
jgi:beta-lactamase class A